MRHVILLAALALCACGPSADEIRAKKEFDRRTAQMKRQVAVAKARAKMVTRLKAVVVADWRDPASAQWRNLKLNEDNLCGEVNAKNAFGGYVGYDKFITTPKMVLFEKHSSVEAQRGESDAAGELMSAVIVTLYDECQKVGFRIE